MTHRLRLSFATPMPMLPPLRLLRLLRLLPLACGLALATAQACAQASEPAAKAQSAEPAAKTPAVKSTTRAAAPIAAATPVAVDPMEQLRQRLAERLSSGKQAPAAASGPVEVRVPSNSMPGARVVTTSASTAAVAAGGHAGAASVARKPGSAQGAQSARSASGGHAQWSYNGPAGPQTWGGLKPEFSLCGNGQRQSPIDIRGGLQVDLEPVRFAYQATGFAVIDNGHTVQANLAPGNSIEVGDKRFELLQFHFHRPSEERIDGRQFEMSLHLLHKDEQGRLAVVALLLDKGQPQPAVQKVWNNLPLEKLEEVPARIPLDLNELLPADRRYFTYMGSLTTPPCSEGVQWIVMRQPVTVSAEQIELFARMYPMNSRPVQQAGGRRILQSQ